MLKISKSKSTNRQSSEIGISDGLDLQGENNLDNRTQIGSSVASTKEAEVQTPEDNQSNLSADIVARVLGAYHFDGWTELVFSNIC